MEELTVRGSADVSSELRILAQGSMDYIGKSVSENTKRAMASDWAAFSGWCAEHGLVALPASPETVMMYLTSMAEGHKVSTIQRHMSTISKAHNTAEVDNPVDSRRVKTTMKGIANTLGTAQTRKHAISIEDLRAVVSLLPDTLIGVRDRAILLIGFAGAFRRSELVALDVSDVEFVPEGCIITVRRSKTDQEGEGQQKAIHSGREGLCPVESLRAWLTAARIESGPVFLATSSKGFHEGNCSVVQKRIDEGTIAQLIKRSVLRAGLDPTQFSGHSLRAGFATEAAKAGCHDRDIMRQTGHKSQAMVQRYIRDGNLFRNNASARVGL